MLQHLNSLGYLTASLQKLLARQPADCPVCGSHRTTHLKAKYLVTSLRLCADCRLMFRYPKDRVADNLAFYQHSYREAHITDLPDSRDLAALLRQNAPRPDWDFTPRLAVLQTLGVKPGLKILDFGCSWGYGAHQLRRAGYDAVGFEISAPRARFGRENLGLAIFSNRLELTRAHARSFDAILAVHVLEHLPDLGETMAWFDALMKPGARLVAFCPNGNLKRAQLGVNLHRLWGRKHPLLLDAAFFQNRFAHLGWPCCVASSPYDLAATSRWPDDTPNPPPSLVGDELLAVAWKL
jgi:2-polyprenyl-3-methyl-5-hydroxy-6-metoxy-1,4-benzoquinol methylase